MIRRFYINGAKSPGELSIITGRDARHIKNVLRLKPGTKIRLFDAKGWEYDAIIKSMGIKSVTVEIMEKSGPVNESFVHITIGQGFLKDKKMDFLVRQLTELGINCWIPFFSQRSVPKPDKKRLELRMERWKKIACESLKQCRRSKIPETGHVLSYEEMIKAGDNYDLKIIFWEGASSEDFAWEEFVKKEPERILALVGPEGGFSAEEAGFAKKRGFVAASLGPRILRAETATVAVCTLIQHFFGDLK